jgi:hypothetical protein
MRIISRHEFGYKQKIGCLGAFTLPTAQQIKRIKMKKEKEEFQPCEHNNKR